MLMFMSIPMPNMRTATRRNVFFDGMFWDISATYGIRQIENQDPYLSLTGEARSEHGDEEGGQIHETLLRVFPWLSLMATVHLRNALTGEPLHARENSWYWFTNADPKNLPDDWVNMSPAERAASYLNCDPAIFEGVATDNKAEFIARVGSLRPAWLDLVNTVMTIYDLV